MRHLFLPILLLMSIMGICQGIPDESNFLRIDKSGDSLSEEVDHPPRFPGGVDSMYAYLNREMHYPKHALDRRIEGTVHVRFTIDENGRTSDIKVIKSANASLNSEAARLIREMPRWEPGSHEGKPVKVQYTLPFVFEIVYESVVRIVPWAPR